MKLSEVFKGGTYPEPSKEGIQQALIFFELATVLTLLEGGKFELLKRDDYYALRRTRDNKVMCWVELLPKKVGDIVGLELMILYCLPEFRNGVAVSVLLFSAKQFLNKPIIVDSVVSKQGQALLNAVLKRSKHFNVLYVDKNTGEAQLFDNNMLEPFETDHVLVIEQYTQTPVMHKIAWPGGGIQEWVLSFFEEDHENLMK